MHLPRDATQGRAATKRSCMTNATYCLPRPDEVRCVRTISIRENLSAPMIQPVLSIGVLPFSDTVALTRCLDALHAQKSVGKLEILVPFSAGAADIAGLAEHYPETIFIPVPGARTPAELRARAVAIASAEIVALIEDHCVPNHDWCTRILAAHSKHSEPFAGVGGAVEKGLPAHGRNDTALNWAVYMTDYSRYMNPLTDGPIAEISDTNSSYKKRELVEILSVWKAEFHENVVNEALRQRGRLLWFAPDVIVNEQRSLTLRAALRDRYAFGRLFASTRVDYSTTGRRIVLAAASCAMPPVLVLRVARTLLQRRKHRAQFVRSLPQLLLVTSAWMAGEMMGYLTARPENSLAAGLRENGLEA